MCRGMTRLSIPPLSLLRGCCPLSCSLLYSHQLSLLSCPSSVLSSPVSSSSSSSYVLWLVSRLTSPLPSYLLRCLLGPSLLLFHSPVAVDFPYHEARRPFEDRCCIL